MTDLDKFVDLYASVGIQLVPVKNELTGMFTVDIEAKSQPKIVGYEGFVTVLLFSPDGKFINQGVWE